MKKTAVLGIGVTLALVAMVFAMPGVSVSETEGIACNGVYHCRTTGTGVGPEIKSDPSCMYRAVGVDCQAKCDDCFNHFAEYGIYDWYATGNTCDAICTSFLVLGCDA